MKLWQLRKSVQAAPLVARSLVTRNGRWQSTNTGKEDLTVLYAYRLRAKSTVKRNSREEGQDGSITSRTGTEEWKWLEVEQGSANGPSLGYGSNIHTYTYIHIYIGANIN